MINSVKDNEKNYCPIEKPLSIIGGKWTLLILKELAYGTKRFGQLQKSLQGISPKTLSHRLQDLEKEGIINKQVFPEVPPRVEYSFTPRGQSLIKIIVDLIEWGKEYYSDSLN